jgi:hypothetical protein
MSEVYMASVTVSINVVASHYWPEAPARRAYLAHMHPHEFQIVAWAKVSHDDREIELHDLRAELLNVAMGMLVRHQGVLTFGARSCEAICREILERIPKLASIQVLEDGSCGAEMTREDLGEDKPKIVTICGSTKFRVETEAAIKLMEERGHIALSVGSFMHADSVPISPQQKEMFDWLHKRKIDLSDYIYVVNVGGYVGSSTKSEIAYAKARGIPVEYLEEEPQV